MTKPMGSERSVMLISRLFLLNLLLLWQSGTGRNSTTFDNESIYKAARDYLLPEDEDLYAEIKCGSPDNTTTNGSFRSVTVMFDHIAHNSNLNYNQLSGGIPSTLGQLQHLKYLDLSSNLLTGSIPSSLTKLQNLKYLDLSFNNLSGSIPETFRNLTELYVL
ncbi:hypothetical protein D5086_029407, partial [Populus alba]